MKNVMDIIKANGVKILKRGAIATVIIAGLTIAGKTIFAAVFDDEEEYDSDEATINDEDEA